MTVERATANCRAASERFFPDGTRNRFAIAASFVSLTNLLVRVGFS